MKVPLLLFLCMYLCLFSFAQPSIQWQKSFGGTGVEYASSIQQTTDGGYIIAGSSTSNDSDVTGHRGSSTYLDFWIVKLDTAGTIQWQRSLGGTDNDYASSIKQTTDGGFIAAGYSYSNDSDVTGHHGIGGVDAWVVKLDTAGNIRWQKSLGGSSIDIAESVDQALDGGYVVAGGTYSDDGDVTGHHGSLSYADYWIVKLDTAGTILWQKSLGGTLQDYAYSIQSTSDSGYIVAGNSDSNDSDVTVHRGNTGISDYWIVKLDTGGNIQWQRSLGGSGYDNAFSVQQTADGGYIAGGGSYSNDSDVTVHHGDFVHDDYWAVKLDTAGNIQWQKSFGGSHYDNINSIRQTSDGGYIVAGRANSNDGDVTNHFGTAATSDCWLLKLDTAGGIEWQKSFGGTSVDLATSARQTTDSGFIMTGWSQSNDGDVTGHHGAGSSFDYWVVKLNLIVTGIENKNDPSTNLLLSPNPFSLSTNISFFISQPGKIKVSIYDTTGRVVKNLSGSEFTKGFHKLTWNATDGSNHPVADGIYFVRIETDNYSETKKISLVR